MASPAQKRTALALVSLEAARLSHTTDALHLCLLGGWTSVLMFRRPLMSILASAHKVVNASQVDSRKPVLCALPRPAAQELALLAVLSPLAQSDLASSIDPVLYASDASETKGGYVKATVGSRFTRPLWRTASKKGGYSRLLSKEEAILAKFDDPEVFDMRAVLPPPDCSPQRPLAYVYDFIEVYSGSGRVGKAVGGKGWSVGPAIDIAESPAFDMEWLRTIEWLLFLLQRRRLRSFLVAPPCTTFSPAAHPACRSYAVPRGFRPSAPKTLLGTTLALRALTLLFVALLVGAIGVLEQPRLSKMAWLKEWRRLIALGAREFWTASCSFGSVRRKEFRFLAVGRDLTPICKPCARDHPHIRVEGRYTRDSAMYTPLLAEALAHEFSQALRRSSHVAAAQKVNTPGLENPIVNDIVLSSAWVEGDSWYWRSPVHINILESAAVLRLLRSLAFSGPRRVVILVDSSVTLNAASKRRSPSRGLTPILRKIFAVCLLSGLYPVFHFVPTRLNPADCPTRDYPLPSPAQSSFAQLFCEDQVYEGLAALKLKRWAANWARLCLLLRPHAPGLLPHLGWRNHRRAPLDFDQTLGFPGEGPLFLWVWFFLVTGWTWALSHGPLRPRNRADETRMRARSAVALCEGRPWRPPRGKGGRSFCLTLLPGWLGSTLSLIRCFLTVFLARIPLTSIWYSMVETFLRLAGLIPTTAK